MKVEVGQWARDDNRIFEITKEITCIFINLDIKSEINNVKVADTPQELIEVGDLVVDTEYKNPFTVDGFTKTKDGKCLLNDIDGWIIPLKDVTKILTPNGKDYICQWEEKR